MSKLLFSTCLLFLCTTILSAQNIQIFGRIMDAQSKQPLEFANVVLTTADTTFVGGASSDKSGDFIVANVPAGDYRLVVSSIGYQTAETVLPGVTKALDLGSLELEENSVSLSEVTVKASNEKNKADRKIVFPSES